MAEIDLRDQNNVRDMLPHKPMRLSMENKNLLSKKGDIYVGTGGTQTVNIEDDTYKIAETTKVSVPSEVISSNESAILIYDKTNNLQYKKSSESGFVTYGVEQRLNDGQKSKARKNIGAAAVSDLTFVSYMVEQGLNDGQKSTARKNIGAVAASDLTFLSYTVDQTGIFVDSSEQGSSLKTTLLNNIFYGLTEDQKSSVRLNIGAGSAQGIAGITAGNGIKVDSNTPSSPKVSVNLAQNSGLVFDSSSPKGLKLNVNSESHNGDKYWVQIDSDNHPYVNVSVPSSDNQTIAYAPTTTSSVSDWIVFDNKATVKLVPGNNINMTANRTNNYIKIDATDTKYSAAVRGGIKLEGTSFSLNTGNVTGEKNYAVQLENGIPYVHVDWMNTTYTGDNGISVAGETISVNLADNSGLVFDSSSHGKLRLNVNSSSQPENNKYWVQIDSNNNYPYVNVSVPSSDNQRIAYAPDLHSVATTFGDNSLVKLVPGDNISMDVNTDNDYIQINATQYSAAVGGGIKLDGTSFSLNTGTITTNKDYAVALSSGGIPYVHVPWVKYTGSNGISVAGETISLKEGYNVPIEYKSSASSTAGFTSNKLYLIGTWTGV